MAGEEDGHKESNHDQGSTGSQGRVGKDAGRVEKTRTQTKDTPNGAPRGERAEESQGAPGEAVSGERVGGRRWLEGARGGGRQHQESRHEETVPGRG